VALREFRVLPRRKRLPRAVLNQAHARRLVASPDPHTPWGKRDRALLELLYGTAIRVGVCERLDLKDLDLARDGTPAVSFTYATAGRLETRTTSCPVDPNDHTPPVITLVEPPNATPLP